jgi:hypothetical protein
MLWYAEWTGRQTNREIEYIKIPGDRGAYMQTKTDAVRVQACISPLLSHSLTHAFFCVCACVCVCVGRDSMWA